MAAVDPQGSQKYWGINGEGPFTTLARTGVDPGAQKWWPVAGATIPTEFTLSGLIGSAPTPPTPTTSTFPALTVAG
jgi:hypothetical protein